MGRGSLIPLKGPRGLGGATSRDDGLGFRDFSPEFYADVFEDFGVTAVVRLNEPQYDGRRFEEGGMEAGEGGRGCRCAGATRGSTAGVGWA